MEVYRWRPTLEALRHRIGPCQFQDQQLPCQWSRVQVLDKQVTISPETKARETDCWGGCVLFRNRQRTGNASMGWERFVDPNLLSTLDSAECATVRPGWF